MGVGEVYQKWKGKACANWSHFLQGDDTHVKAAWHQEPVGRR